MKVKEKKTPVRHSFFAPFAKLFHLASGARMKITFYY